MKALQISNLQKTYANGLQALKGINLEVEEGDFFALLGPNGAGKSTTIGIVTSLIKKTAGSVLVFGNNLETHSVIAKSLIGIVPQEINFSQFENCLEIVVNQGGYYGINRKLARESAEKYLRQLGLWEKRLDSSRTLSGGLKRRLMIARALIHEPRLLILDEPTAGVDVELRRSMWSFLREINNQGTTIVLTTHYLEEAENLCKHIAIINKGEIIENTSMKSLLDKLDTQTFVLDLNKPINQPLNLNAFKSHIIDPMTIEIEITKDKSMNDLFKMLSEKGVQIKSMRNKSNRLEELFINLLNNS